MAGRCGCSGTTCSCQIVGDAGITVTGTGTVKDPYKISGGSAVSVADTSTIDMVLSGSGTVLDPYVISGNALVALDELTDVVTSGGSTGDVLTLQSDGTFALGPPSTASPGAITVGNGLTGDGSGGSPLAVLLAPSSGLSLTGSGLALAGGLGWTDYTPTLKTTSTSSVAIGNGTLQGRYVQIGNTVFVRINLVRGSTTETPSGYFSVSLPVAAEYSLGLNTYPIPARRSSSGYSHLSMGYIAEANYISRTLYGETNKMTMTTLDVGDTIQWVGLYEAA